ncbi:MAG TPA: hypothetical protein VF266_08405 [Thermoanaerobaculia bacterium]
MVPRVLVLEPYSDLSALIAATLQREHYQCDVVSTAADAALELRRHDYAYVVVDLDTLDSVALVAGIDPSSQVILLTSEGDEPALRKPFSRAELMARFVA